MDVPWPFHVGESFSQSPVKYFEGEVLALADLAALESHSGTDPALLCSSDSYAIFSLWLPSSEFDLLSLVPFSILF